MIMGNESVQNIEHSLHTGLVILAHIKSVHNRGIFNFDNLLYISRLLENNCDITYDFI